MLGAVLLGGFFWYERDRPPAKVLALVAALAALAVVGRLAFAAIPNVQPTTDIALFAGYALGAVPGFAVGATAALVSNVFLSQGPWTAWQMAGWGAVGVGGALLARAAHGRELGRLPLAVACALAGLAFGAFMDVYQWTLAARQDLPTYLAVSARSVPFNLAHALGNAVFCLLIGPPFVRALRRYRRRFEVRWQVAPGGPALAAATGALAVAVALTAAPDAGAASSSTRAVRYLEGAQNRDGGFGAAPRQRSSQLFTGWAALGLAAARRNPQDVRRRGGASITTYIRRRAGSLRDVGALERTILVVRAAGLSPRSFARRNLVAELLARRRGDGSWAANVTFTAFGVLALRAAGIRAQAESARWLEDAQNGDGGFGYTARAPSDVDDTGAVLQALAAAGRRGGPPARRAVSYLSGAQNGDGGFGQMRGRSSNAQSTAWAVQGLLAARAAPGAVDRALAFLKRLQRRNGSIRYSRTSGQTPVWVTAQALAALRRKPFPLPVAPRRRRARRAGGPGPSAAPTARRKARRPRAAAARGPHLRAGAAARRALAGIRSPAERAAATREPEDGGGGVPAPVLAGAGAATLLCVWLLRRRLRRRSA